MTGMSAKNGRRCFSRSSECGLLIPSAMKRAVRSPKVMSGFACGIRCRASFSSSWYCRSIASALRRFDVPVDWQWRTPSIQTDDHHVVLRLYKDTGLHSSFPLALENPLHNLIVLEDQFAQK